MARYLIEVPHEAEEVACARVVEIFLKTGSHFVTHTETSSRWRRSTTFFATIGINREL